MRVMSITAVAIGEEDHLLGDNNIDDDGNDVLLDVVPLSNNIPSTMESKDLLDREGMISGVYTGGSLPTG